jgi:hypothetical protein
MQVSSSGLRNDMSKDTFPQNMHDASGVVCELCQIAASTIAAIIPPLGNAAGKRIFYCEPCDHYTFVDWLGSHHISQT